MQPVIELDGLSVRFGKLHALRELTGAFSGRAIGLLGPNGAGKSTLQKVMTKLLPLQQGAIRYDGVSIDAYGRELFARIGVSFEHPNLFPKLSGRENLTCFLGLYPPRSPQQREDPDALMDAVGLGDAKDKLAGDYSKGMKQRLVLLRSLMHSPDILFLDEPLSGLDPATGERVKALIDDRWADDKSGLRKAEIAKAMEQAFCDTPQEAAGLTAETAAKTSRWLPDGMIVVDVDEVKVDQSDAGDGSETPETEAETLPAFMEDAA